MFLHLSLSRGVCSGGSLSRGSLSRRSLGGSLSGGLCVGGSLSRGSLSRGSLSGGSLSRGSLFGRSLSGGSLSRGLSAFLLYKWLTDICNFCAAGHLRKNTEERKNVKMYHVRSCMNYQVDIRSGIPSFGQDCLPYRLSIR